MMNGERLCGLLHHMCTCQATQAQTLWEAEAITNTIQSMVLHLNRLHQTTAILQRILCHSHSCQLTDQAGDIHTLPQHGQCTSSSAVVPHPCVFQTWGPGAHYLRPWVGVCIALLLFPRKAPQNEATLHIGLPPRSEWTDRVCHPLIATALTSLHYLPT